MLENGADLGVAFDGDADRIGVVDETGGIIWGDMLMCLYWREIMPKHPGAPAIIEVKCSRALVDEVVRLGGRPFFYKTGHSLIKARMKEIGAVFTGEMSGHTGQRDRSLVPGKNKELRRCALGLRQSHAKRQSVTVQVRDSTPAHYHEHQDDLWFFPAGTVNRKEF